MESLPTTSVFLIALSALTAALIINELYRYLGSRPSAKPTTPKEYRNDEPISTRPVHNYPSTRLDRDVPASLTYKVQSPTPADVSDTTVETSAERADECLSVSDDAIDQVVDEAPNEAGLRHTELKDLSTIRQEDNNAEYHAIQRSSAIHRITQSPSSTHTQELLDYRMADRIDPWERRYEQQFKTIEDVLREDTTNLFIQTSTLVPVVKRLTPVIQQLHGQTRICSAHEKSAIRNGLASLFDLFRLSHDPMKVERLVAKRQPNDAVLANLSWLVITDAQKLDPATAYALSHCLQRAFLNDLPFGGVRVILVGDFLSPMRDMSDDVKDNLLERFGSLSCLAAPPMQQVPFRKITLVNMDSRKTYRLRESLSRIVSGDVTRSDFQLIQPKPVDNDFLTLVRSHEEAIHINDRMAEQLGEKRTVFVCERGQHVSLDMLPCPERLSVCIGARVMFLTNHVEDIWYRGCLGTVTSMRADRIHVQIDNGSKVVVERHTWQAPMYHRAGFNTQDNQPYHTVKQFPLTLGWAIDVSAAHDVSIPRLHIHDVLHRQGSSSMLYCALNAATDLASVSSSTALTPAAFRVSDDYTAMALGHRR